MCVLAPAAHLLRAALQQRCCTADLHAALAAACAQHSSLTRACPHHHALFHGLGCIAHSTLGDSEGLELALGAPPAGGPPGERGLWLTLPLSCDLTPLAGFAVVAPHTTADAAAASMHAAPAMLAAFVLPPGGGPARPLQPRLILPVRVPPLLVSIAAVCLHRLTHRCCRSPSSRWWASRTRTCPHGAPKRAWWSMRLSWLQHWRCVCVRAKWNALAVSHVGSPCVRYLCAACHSLGGRVCRMCSL